MSGKNYKQKENLREQQLQAPIALASQTIPRKQYNNVPNYEQTAPSKEVGQHQFDNNYARYNVNEENQALIERVRQLEEQVRQQAEGNRNLYEQLSKTEGELTKARQVAQRNGESTNLRNAQVGELNNRYHEIAQGHNQFLDNARSHAFTVQRELEHKDEEIKRLRGLLEEKSDKLKFATVSQEKNFDRCIGLDREVATLLEENKNLREDLRRKAHQLDMERLSHKAEGTFMVEVEHLKADVQRLVLMLKNTEEYKEFSDISDDAAHSIRFLKDIKARTYVDNKCNKNCRLIRPCQCPSTGENQWVEDEKLLWVPEEAYKFAHEFRVKYDGELTDTLIEKLLFELNKIWSKREQRLLKRIKGNAAHETAGLRRQLAFNPTYDEHQAKATIQRLQRELKQAYKENREAFGQRERRNPVGTSYVNETLKITKAGDKKKKDIENKNNLLKSKIQNMELNKYGSLSEKSVFMEGAAWMSNQISKEFDGLQKAISAHSTQLHSQQDTSHSHSQSFGPADSLRKCNWLIENVDTELGNFKNKLQQINNNTEKSMIDSVIVSRAIARPHSAIIDTF